MHVENITSNAMSLDRNGQSMLIQVYEKEIDRLNNIINELEKYCNEEIIDYDKAIDSKILSEIDRDRYEAEKVCFLDMLDKLKALKENNNE